MEQADQSPAPASAGQIRLHTAVVSTSLSTMTMGITAGRRQSRGLATPAAPRVSPLLVLAAVGFLLLSGCQTPGRVLQTEASQICPACRTETRSAAIRGLSYKSHRCKSCRTVSTLPDSATGALGRDTTDRGRLSTTTPVVHLMIQRLQTGLPHVSMAELSARAAELRQVAQRSQGLELEEKASLLNAAEDMEALVSLVTKNVVHRRGEV